MNPALSEDRISNLRKSWVKSDKGFTLIEFVMMIVVGSFLVSGIVLFTKQQVISATEMRDFLIASNLSRLKIAQMNNAAYPAVGTTTPSAEASFPGFIFRQVVTSVAASGGSSVRQVQLDVDYTGGSFSNPLVRLITYRQSDTTFGNGT